QDAPVVLDERTTTGIVWQDEDSRFGLVELKNITLDGQTEVSVTARLTSKKVKTKLSHKNGNTCAYKIKVKLRLESMQVLGTQIAQSERKKALEREFERMIENSVMYAAAVSKERGIDFLELRSRFHRFCTKGYKTFDLKSTDVSVKAEVKLMA
ncbi:MAG: Ger(x)C family spore germination C-terminal domain-containing protein, partial [Clostridiales bacterium]|nr:Ger(x)C family spore germination C-terminal domain-containing protein [Clostridiales bacterium]